MTTFRIPAVPVAQPRQRQRVVNSKGKQFVSNYTPTKHPANVFKATAKHAYAEATDKPPLNGALNVSLVFVFPRPRNKIWKTRAMPSYPHTKKPDADNLAKCVLDALNGLAWVDDSQICELRCVKRVAAGDEQAFVEVSIEEITE